jgi:type 1 glutamine amidotransferase
MKPWEMTDETYTMNEPGDDSEVLLTTTHEKSMKSIGWVRRFKSSRVFCFQSGHDNESWNNAEFRKMLERGIRWSAGNL